MIKGRVIGRIWSTKRIESLPQGALLEVEVEGGVKVIAFDPLGCGDDEQVLITQGSVAAGFFEGFKAPVDALIIGSIDEHM
ncbi:MAG: ethanolamine utilization protein EutN [Rhodospirillales bacterium]|nr:ethanolamine utilization protein EutN [Rhodospirillales bacterium]